MTEEQVEAHKRRTQAARKVTFFEPEKRGPHKKIKIKAPKIKLREADVLAGCIKILDSHPEIALWWRQNVSGVKFGEHYVRFGFKGASDLMAVLKGGGRFMAVETKSTGKKATPEQDAFLNNVRVAGGVAFCVDDPAQLIKYLACLGN